MKYVPMQTGMWAVFAGSFRKILEAVLDLDPKTAGESQPPRRSSTAGFCANCRILKKATGFS